MYNLAIDPFGQTRYRIDYTVQQDIRRGVGVFGAMAAAFRKLMGTKKPQVAVGYEREGREAWEQVYLELDPKDIKPGLNQLAVQVKDLVTEKTVMRQALFRLYEKKP